MKKNEKVKEQIDRLNTDELINLCYKRLDLQKKDEDALKFMTIFIQFIEEQLTKQLIEVLSKPFIKTNKPKIMELIIRDMNWNQKIKTLKYSDDEKKSFKNLIKFFDKMNYIRNEIFHVKFSELKFNKKNINEIQTQRDIVFHYWKANEEVFKKKLSPGEK